VSSVQKQELVDIQERMGDVIFHFNATVFRTADRLDADLGVILYISESDAMLHILPSWILDCVPSHTCADITKTFRVIFIDVAITVALEKEEWVDVVNESNNGCGEMQNRDESLMRELFHEG
jgi:hypothetical protein